MLKNLLLYVGLVMFIPAAFAVITELPVEGVTTNPLEDPELNNGYNPIGTADPGVVEAANFAAQQINAGKFLRVVSSSSRVENGITYALVIQVTADDGSIHTYNATVVSPLPTTATTMQLSTFSEQ